MYSAKYCGEGLRVVIINEKQRLLLIYSSTIKCMWHADVYLCVFVYGLQPCSLRNVIEIREITSTTSQNVLERAVSRSPVCLFKPNW